MIFLELFINFFATLLGFTLLIAGLGGAYLTYKGKEDSILVVLACISAGLASIVGMFFYIWPTWF